MVKQILEKMLSHSGEIAQQGWSLDTSNVGQVAPATTIAPGRRCEARMDYLCPCSYEVVEVIEEKSVVIGQGGAFAVNRSTEGMLLLIIAMAPNAKQLIEVHTSRYGWGQSASVFEVRLAKPIQVESFGNLSLVGCRRVFGPCHYLSF